jgi:uncharacterized membrane protein YsdA (DUF1294 family)/cold shock CspA family protein
MRYQGKITSWKDDQGFGFITPNGGGEPVFVHIKAFANRLRRPEGDELVTYELRTDARGRPRAENVAFVGERTQPGRGPGRSGKLPIMLALGFVGLLAAVTIRGRLPVAVPALYAVASVVAFFAYAWDKSAARKGEWRTRESTLHLFALVGGWPGALAAQRLLRHKSSKQEFQTVFWGTVVINCGALGWLFTATGAELLRSVLSKYAG